MYDMKPWLIDCTIRLHCSPIFVCKGFVIKDTKENMVCFLELYKILCHKATSTASLYYVTTRYTNACIMESHMHHCSRITSTLIHTLRRLDCSQTSLALSLPKFSILLTWSGFVNLKCQHYVYPSSPRAGELYINSFSMLTFRLYQKHNVLIMDVPTCCLHWLHIFEDDLQHSRPHVLMYFLHVHENMHAPTAHFIIVYTHSHATHVWRILQITRLQGVMR